MKITRELKEIIERQISAKRAADEREENDRRMQYAEEVNRKLSDSDEFSALFDAARKWDRLVKKIVEESGFKLSQHTNGYRNGEAWNMGEFLKCADAAPVLHNRVSYADKYDAIRDTVILKLSYGKDFNEAVEILKEYGIELG